MLATLRVGPDMCGFERGEDPLTRYSTSALVGVGDDDPKCTLAEARADEHRFPEPCSGLRGLSRGTFPFLTKSHTLRSKTHLDIVPESPAKDLVQVVPLALHDVRLPVRWDGNPLALGKEERLLEKNTA